MLEADEDNAEYPDWSIAAEVSWYVWMVVLWPFTTGWKVLTRHPDVLDSGWPLWCGSSAAIGLEAGMLVALWREDWTTLLIMAALYLFFTVLRGILYIADQFRATPNHAW